MRQVGWRGDSSRVLLQYPAHRRCPPGQYHIAVQLEGEAVQLGEVGQVLAHCRF